MFAPLYTRRHSDIGFVGSVKLNGETIVDCYCGPDYDMVVFGNDAKDYVRLEPDGTIVRHTSNEPLDDNTMELCKQACKVIYHII